MQTKPHFSFLTFLLLISFASVNAVLFTPALPAIANFFAISNALAQQTITWFLVGYTIGQLIYGPIANRFGRKPALYAGIFLQILSSALCIFSGIIHVYVVLLLGRFLLALGSGVGLKMTFTLINETYEPIVASQKISYLIIAFAITPGLGITVGGILTTYFGWQSTFYAGMLYGVILLILAIKLPETKKSFDLNALQLKHLIMGYRSQFKNVQLIAAGILMGGASCFVYVFAALAPLIAINLLHMNSATYGIANLLPPLGLVLGSLISAQLTKKISLVSVIQLGIYITLFSSVVMLLLVLLKMPALLSLFIPLMLSYFGLALVFANASTIAMTPISDKAHGSAVMNFINMGFATCMALGLGFLTIQILLLPIVFINVSIIMFISQKFLLGNCGLSHRKPS